MASSAWSCTTSCYDPHLHLLKVARLECEDGSPLLPTAVLVGKGEDVIVGSGAIQAGLEAPHERLVRWFPSRRDRLDETIRLLDGKEWNVPRLTIEILNVLKRKGETFFGAEIREVALASPVRLGDKAMRLIETAAHERLGLQVVSRWHRGLAAVVSR